MKTLKSLNVSGKRAILRVDFNVPLEKGKIQDDYRIKASLPTIRYLLGHGASVIIIAHRGRPDEAYHKDLSLEPTAKDLSRLLKKKILFAKDIPEAERMVKTLSKRGILMLENIRFVKGEIENSPSLAKRLARLGDIYVNDAFGDCHRTHASIVGIPKILPHAAGLLLQQEVSVLQKVSRHPERPMVAVIGGAKISTKLPLIKYFLKQADGILVGGAIANTILASEHMMVGKSVVESNADVSWLKLTDKKLHLPVDAVVTTSLTGKGENAIRGIGNVKQNEYIADVGPDSLALFSAIIKKAKTIIWNGPLGFIEVFAFAKGTRGLLKAVAASKGCTVIGGGDLHRVVKDMKLEKKIDHISTGGGAMLELLAGKKLPGIEALK